MIEFNPQIRGNGRYFVINELPEVLVYDINGHPNIRRNRFIYDAKYFGEKAKVEVNIQGSIDDFKEKLKLFIDHHLINAQTAIEEIGDVPEAIRLIDDLKNEERRIRTSARNYYEIDEELRNKLPKIEKRISELKSKLDLPTLYFRPYNHFLDLACRELAFQIKAIEPELIAMGYEVSPLLYHILLEDGPSHEAHHHLRASIGKDDYYEVIKKNIEEYKTDIKQLKLEIKKCKNKEEKESLKEKLRLEESYLKTYIQDLNREKPEYRSHKKKYSVFNSEYRHEVILQFAFKDKVLELNLYVTPMNITNEDYYEVRIMNAPEHPSHRDIMNIVWYLFQNFKIEWICVQELLSRLNINEMFKGHTQEEVIKYIRDYDSQWYYDNVFKSAFTEQIGKDINLIYDLQEIIQKYFPKDMGLSPEFIYDHKDQYPDLYQKLFGENPVQQEG